jgi:hypothetical protein
LYLTAQLASFVFTQGKRLPHGSAAAAAQAQLLN